MSAHTKVAACPRCVVSYGVMPQTYDAPRTEEGQPDAPDLHHVLPFLLDQCHGVPQALLHERVTSLDLALVQDQVKMM